MGQGHAQAMVCSQLVFYSPCFHLFFVVVNCLRLVLDENRQNLGEYKTPSILHLGIIEVLYSQAKREHTKSVIIHTSLYSIFNQIFHYTRCIRLKRVTGWRAHLCVIAPSNTAPFEKMSLGGEPLATLCPI